jgi:hypothetical protein
MKKETEKREKKYRSSHRITTNFTDYHHEGNQRSDQIIEVTKGTRIRSSYTTNVEGTTKTSNCTINIHF